jgi:hypothetical protein
MHKDTTQWLCSSGCGKGNAIHFLSMLREMSYADAEAHIANRYGIGPATTIDGDLEAEVRRNILGVVEQEPQRVLPSESWIAKLHYDWEVGGRARDYMVVVRGFDPSVLTDFEVGYDERTDRITIPVRDVEDCLVGFKARAIDVDAHPRYLILGNALGQGGFYDFDTYRKSEVVFGLNLVPFGSSVVVMEGELNVIACAQKTPYLCAVGVAGSEFSESQRRLITERCSDAVVIFDDDGWKCRCRLLEGREHAGKQCQECGTEVMNPGVKGASKVVSALMQSMPVRVAFSQYGDPAEMTAQEISELVISADPALLALTRGDLPVLAST